MMEGINLYKNTYNVHYHSSTTHLVLEEVLSFFESTQLPVDLVVGEAAGVRGSEVVAKVI